MDKVNARIVKIGNSNYLILPVDLINDSSFPFFTEDREDLVIEIRGHELTVRKLAKGEVIS